MKIHMEQFIPRDKSVLKYFCKALYIAHKFIYKPHIKLKFNKGQNKLQTTEYTLVGRNVYRRPCIQFFAQPYI